MLFCIILIRTLSAASIQSHLVQLEKRGAGCSKLYCVDQDSTVPNINQDSTVLNLNQDLAVPTLTVNSPVPAINPAPIPQVKRSYFVFEVDCRGVSTEFCQMAKYF